ncbi:MAG: ABC transporter ATP-binding protein [Acidobacteriota bacterium]
MTTGSTTIIFDNVSKFYGETLGVNRVKLALPPGITSLVGPNGSGKSTLMNLMTGLLFPTEGSILVRGTSPLKPESLFRQLGYCTQYDSFPPGITGWRYVFGLMLLHGHGDAWARERAEAAIELVGLTKDCRRRIGAYSKGMRQRIKLAGAIAHDPAVLILDEPLNGLDPMARSEIIGLMRKLAGEGKHIILSSHILHEVDIVSDQVVMLNEGYVVAEGEIRTVRQEVKAVPLQVTVRCDRPSELASMMIQSDSIVEVRMHPDRRGLLVRTEDADRFYLALNKAVVDHNVTVESISPADDDVQSVYQYLINDNRGANQ